MLGYHILACLIKFGGQDNNYLKVWEYFSGYENSQNIKTWQKSKELICAACSYQLSKEAFDKDIKLQFSLTYAVVIT